MPWTLHMQHSKPDVALMKFANVLSCNAETRSTMHLVNLLDIMHNEVGWVVWSLVSS